MTFLWQDTLRWDRPQRVLQEQKADRGEGRSAGHQGYQPQRQAQERGERINWLFSINA